MIMDECEPALNLDVKSAYLELPQSLEILAFQNVVKPARCLGIIRLADDLFIVVRDVPTNINIIVQCKFFKRLHACKRLPK